MSEGAIAFFGGLMKTGYMMPLIFGTQVLVGALLLSNRFVPLALALIAPVIVNIVAFHAFLAPLRGGYGRRRAGAGALSGLGVPSGVTSPCSPCG